MAQPSRLLHGVRDKVLPPPSEFRLHSFIVNSTHADIQTKVANAWGNERIHWVGQVSSHLQKVDIAPENAVKYAKEFVSALENVNGPHPTAFPSVGKVNAHVNALILKLPSEAQQMFLEYEEKYDWYSKYAYNFMQVRIRPVEVKVGGWVPNSVLDWQFNNLMMVTSPISLPNVGEVRPAELKACFKRLVSDKSKHFWLNMIHSSEITYVIRAFNVLVQKMFEKSGIDFTGQTAEQIREGVLKNIKHDQGLRNFSAIDATLVQMIAFLSCSYIFL